MIKRRSKVSFQYRDDRKKLLVVSLSLYSSYQYPSNLHALPCKEKRYFRIVAAVIKGLNNSTTRLEAKIAK